MWASMNYLELKLTKNQASIGSHSGACDSDIKALMKEPSIKRQFKSIDPESIKKELRDQGAWTEEQLNNVEDNQERILWIACGNIMDGI